MVEPISGEGIGKDRRARLSAKPAARDLIYGPSSPDNILHPIRESGGMVWPYTPTIIDQGNVQYETYDPVHTNQPFAAFKAVAIKEIQVSGTFTAMNQVEARYCIAAIHFLRTITKMYFGVGGEDQSAISLRGTPPPILLFNGYGTTMFHNVPVIVTGYTVELPQDVDYVEVESLSSSRSAQLTFENTSSIRGDIGVSGGQRGTSLVNDERSAWVPARFVVTAQMQVQNTPDRLRRSFNLNDFRTGKLIKRGGWV